MRSWLVTTEQPGNASSASSRLRERLDVEVVRGLVEQQQVAALLERERQIQAVALAAGKHAGTASAGLEPLKPKLAT